MWEAERCERKECGKEKRYGNCKGMEDGRVWDATVGKVGGDRVLDLRGRKCVPNDKRLEKEGESITSTNKTTKRFT